MLRRPPRSTRTDTLFPYTTLFRSKTAVNDQRLMAVDEDRHVIAMLRADMTSDASDAPPSAPTVWILLGHRAGDNGQALALADALGWPATAKHLRYTGLHHAPNWLLGDSCRHEIGRASCRERVWQYV